MSKKNRNDQWDERLADIRAFAHSHNRWPSTTADEQPEKKLAQWWSRQKYYYRKYKNTGKAPGMNHKRSSSISSLIDAFAHFERDGVWMHRYNKLKRQIDKNGCLWHYDTKNPEEQKTLRWWNQQKTFCRKFLNDKKSRGGMTDRRAKLVQSLQEKIGQPLIKENNNKFKEVLGFDDSAIFKDNKNVQ